MRKRYNLFLLLLIVLIIGLQTNVKASSKEVNYCIEFGKTINLKEVTSKPNISSKILGIEKVSKKGLVLRAKKREGLCTFRYNNKIYNILVLKDNIPNNEVKTLKVKKVKGIYYVKRGNRTNTFVTVYNSNNYDVDVVFTRKEYRSENELFETRNQELKALGKKETYTFFTYLSMPIQKDSIKVTKSKEVKSIDSTKVKVKHKAFEDIYSIYELDNKTNDVVYVDALLVKYDKRGNFTATSELKEIVINPEVSTEYKDKNYTTDISKVKIIDYHVHTSK